MSMSADLKCETNLVQSRWQIIFLMKRLAFVVMVLGLSGTVIAQGKPIPEDMLALDHQRCMQGCVPGYGETTCKPLCDCTVSEFKKTMNFEEYLDMSVQLSRNTISPKLREYLNRVANYCAAEVEKSGVEIGTGETSDDGQTGAGD